jgi:hypothetical protein
MKLTRHEILILVSVLSALLIGAAVKRHRDARLPRDPAPKGLRGR